MCSVHSENSAPGTGQGRQGELQGRGMLAEASLAVWRRSLEVGRSGRGSERLERGELVANMSGQPSKKRLNILQAKSEIDFNLLSDIFSCRHSSWGSPSRSGVSSHRA